MPSRHHNIFLGVLFLLAAAVYYLNAIAQVNFFYWTYWWYDIMMHFLGGLLVSGIVLWTIHRFAGLSPMRIRQTFYLSVAMALLVGIGWELFEYLNGMYIGQTNIVSDTVGDLIMDTVGAITSWSLVSFLFRRDTAHTQL